MKRSVIRPSTQNDVDALAEITLLGWRGAYRTLLPPEFLAKLTLKDRAFIWRKNLAAINFSSFLYEIDDEIAGYLNLRVGAKLADPVEIPAIYLHPEHWRCGIGRQLMRHGLEFVTHRGFGKVFLWVLEGNERARGFYEACGFSTENQRREDRRFGDVAVKEIKYKIEL